MGWIICRASVSVVGLSASAGHSSGVVPFPGVDDDSLPKTGEGQGGLLGCSPCAPLNLGPPAGSYPCLAGPHGSHSSPPPFFFGH